MDKNWECMCDILGNSTSMLFFFPTSSENKRGKEKKIVEESCVHDSVTDPPTEDYFIFIQLNMGLVFQL